MNDINILMWYYNVSATEAYKILAYLTEDEIEFIREEYNKKGI